MMHQKCAILILCLERCSQESRLIGVTTMRTVSHISHGRKHHWPKPPASLLWNPLPRLHKTHTSQVLFLVTECGRNTIACPFLGCVWLFWWVTGSGCPSSLVELYLQVNFYMTVFPSFCSSLEVRLAPQSKSSSTLPQLPHHFLLGALALINL